MPFKVSDTNILFRSTPIKSKLVQFAGKFLGHLISGIFRCFLYYTKYSLDRLFELHDSPFSIPVYIPAAPKYGTAVKKIWLFEYP